MNNDIIIRPVRSDECSSFLEFMNKTDEETDYMSTAPGERQISPFQLSWYLKSGFQVSFIALNHQKIIGQISGFYILGKGQRLKHSIHIGISVLKEYWGQGVGTALMDHFIQWATEMGLERIELHVMCHNTSAIQLYKKNGFQIEGVRRKSIKIKEDYIDEYLMSKLLASDQ